MRYLFLYVSLIALTLCCSCGGDGSSSSETNGVGSPSIVITPKSVKVPVGGAQQFTATVAGLGNTTVLWSVQEGATGGVVDSSGKYIAPATVGTYHIIAQSVASASVSVMETITVFQPGEANGVYLGAYSFEMAFYTIILPDDTFYSIEGKIGPDGVMTNVYRLGSGQGVAYSTDYTVPLVFHLYDYTFSSFLQARYIPGTSLIGSITNASFTATALPTTQLDFNSPADLSHITGTWNGIFTEDMLTGDSVTGTFEIGPNGEIASSMCYSGTITPDVSHNFFNVTIASGAGCGSTIQTLSGVAVEMLLPGGARRQLLMVMKQSPFGFAAVR